MHPLRQKRLFKLLAYTLLIAVTFVVTTTLTNPGMALTIVPLRIPGEAPQNRPIWVLDIASDSTPKTDWNRATLGAGWSKGADPTLPSGAAALATDAVTQPFVYDSKDNAVEIAFATGPEFGVVRISAGTKEQVVSLYALNAGLLKYRFTRPFLYRLTTLDTRGFLAVLLSAIGLWFLLLCIAIAVTRPHLVTRLTKQLPRGLPGLIPATIEAAAPARPLYDGHDASRIPALADNDIAIRVHGVGKMYRIYDQPRDRLKQMLFRGQRQYGHEFWALHNVSFEVSRGETVGIIGRNGSGKSTLLQIIAGTLAPSEGEVQVNGRVAALLELGSGFNPEFTGRENVFLSGAILGFSREEMEARFHEIAAFADIGDFIDQPVKVYSSGMYARLAFAIGIHLEPDIFIIDEALSVGDVFFQSRCVRKLDEFRENGGTVLFVTHDTYTVERICTKAIVLHKGVKRFEGSTSDAVNTYYMIERGLSGSIDTSNTPDKPVHSSEVVLRRDTATTNGAAYIEKVWIYDDQRRPTTTFRVGEWMTVEALVRFNRDLDGFDFGVGLRDRTGILIGGAHTYHQRRTFGPVVAGERQLLTARIRLTVTPLEYLLLIGVSRNQTPQDWEDLYTLWDACVVSVMGWPDHWGLTHLPNTISQQRIQGDMAVEVSTDAASSVSDWL